MNYGGQWLKLELFISHEATMSRPGGDVAMHTAFTRRQNSILVRATADLLAYVDRPDDAARLDHLFTVANPMIPGRSQRERRAMGRAVRLQRRLLRSVYGVAPDDLLKGRAPGQPYGLGWERTSSGVWWQPRQYQ